MRNFVLAFLCFVTYAVSGELPDPKLTPGYMRSTTVTELCTTSTSLVRNVPESSKKDVFSNYGLKGNDRSVCKEGYEIDHLVSLELGGANDIKNLWPQSYCGSPYNAHIKDKLENELHQRVCKNEMTLKAAQDCISSNWTLCYTQIFK